MNLDVDNDNDGDNEQDENIINEPNTKQKSKKKKKKKKSKKKQKNNDPRNENDYKIFGNNKNITLKMFNSNIEALTKQQSRDLTFIKNPALPIIGVQMSDKGVMSSFHVYKTTVQHKPVLAEHIRSSNKSSYSFYGTKGEKHYAFNETMTGASKKQTVNVKSSKKSKSKAKAKSKSNSKKTNTKICKKKYFKCITCKCISTYW